MKVIGLLQARGRGSTIPNKNMYPLNGKPMIWHFLKEMKNAACLDEIGVWTESKKIARTVEDCECHVLDRPREMVHYGSGFRTPEDWHRCIDEETEKKFGSAPYIRVWLNCNHVLFSRQSLEKMFALFINDEKADIIFPVVPVENNIYMINPVDGYLFPVFRNFKTGGQMRLYRKIGMHISVFGLPATPHSGRELHYKVPWHEGRDIQEMDDIKFAEYMLSRRGKNP